MSAGLIAAWSAVAFASVGVVLSVLSLVAEIGTWKRHAKKGEGE